MTTNPIYLKEWLKLRRIFALLLLAAVLIGGYFGFDLIGQFANIEPESMMWYRLIHLNDKPYLWLNYVFILVATVVACCQYIPEISGNKIRILAHLPWSLDRVVIQHLISGSALLLLVNAVLVALTLLVFQHYYPIDIVSLAAKDLLLGQIPALATYLGVCAVIVEQTWLRRATKALTTMLVVYLILNANTHWQLIIEALLVLWLLLLIKDSFLSVKTRRLPLLKPGMPLLLTVLIGSTTWLLYQQYAVQRSHYYLFYSAVLQDFVYQKNGQNHQFFYGTSYRDLSKNEFELALPFVYWKNLDIQGKLPVTVAKQSYNKNTIRSARLSLQYHPDQLERLELPLYPLFNPDSQLGAIRFPENAFVIRDDQFVVFDAETAGVNPDLTTEINQLAQESGIEFPIANIWGKTTNMKPFDWGYFIYDSKGDLYNLKRGDDVMTITKVELSDQIADIAYIQVSENRQKSFYGYAITTDSQVYLISYPNYQMIPLSLAGFDYHKMSLQLLADPLNYLVRFDDGENYHAVLFDKNYQQLATTTRH